MYKLFLVLIASIILSGKSVAANQSYSLSSKIDCHFVLHNHCNIEFDISNIHSFSSETLKSLLIKLEENNIHLFSGSFPGKIELTSDGDKQVTEYQSLFHIHQKLVEIYPHSPSIQNQPLPKSLFNFSKEVDKIKIIAKDIPFYVNDINVDIGKLSLIVKEANGEILSHSSITMKPTGKCWLDQDLCVRQGFPSPPL